MQSILQTQEWAALRESQSWRVHWVDEILVLEKPLPLGLSFLYAPEVDFYKIDWQKKEDPSTSLRMPTFLQKVRQIAQKSRSIFIRYDFLNKNEGYFSPKIIGNLKDLNFIKAFEEIQPEWRQIIDISRSEEQILAQMKQKGRYNIKVAQKKGVTVDRSLLTDGKDLNDFYRIFTETAQRDKFQIRPKKYFEDLLKILGDQATLLVARLPAPEGAANGGQARCQGKILAAVIITCYNETASYLYGASSDQNRETMAPYLLHWEAIREAKRRGCKIYDLLAIAPFCHPEPTGEGSRQLRDSSSQAPQNDKSHKYAGITRFKEQFGGRKVHLVGSWDLVMKPFWYQLFKIAEKMRRK